MTMSYNFFFQQMPYSDVNHPYSGKMQLASVLVSYLHWGFVLMSMEGGIPLYNALKAVFMGRRVFMRLCEVKAW